MIYAIILISGALYRIPRGGGLGEGRSFEGAIIWAAATSAMLSFYFWSWWPIISAPLLMLAEAPKWSKWWPNNPTSNIFILSLRGSLLLNPLMGPIYFTAYKYRDKLPSLPGLNGWTEWSELASGLVTASSLTAILWWLL